MNQSAKKSIVVFEDNPERLTALVKELNDIAKDDFEIIPFDGNNSTNENRPHEERIAEALADQKYHDILLIVCDRDLSGMEKYPGLSETIVSKVAVEIAVPICLYARGPVSVTILERVRDWREGQIVLQSKGFPEMASEIREIADGFADIQVRLPKLSGKPAKTLTDIVSEILEVPEVLETIAMYSSGDQGMLQEVFPFRGEPQDTKHKRQSLLVGQWIYDSILRFPGLIVSDVSAASLLNVSQETIQDQEIMKLLSSALYKGPFFQEEKPRWWRHKLEQLFFENNAEDGRDFLQQRLSKSIPECNCEFGDPPHPAGWYCMVTKKPVCLKHSKGNISWFPRGADLARINSNDYDEIAPWLGLF